MKIQTTYVTMTRVKWAEVFVVCEHLMAGQKLVVTKTWCNVSSGAIIWSWRNYAQVADHECCSAWWINAPTRILVLDDATQ